MKDMISRKALLEAFVADVHYLDIDLYDLAVAEIEDAPIVDAMEVVRCKDCKDWDVDSDTYGDAGGPVGHCLGKFWGEQMAPDDFCSYAEKRE